MTSRSHRARRRRRRARASQRRLRTWRVVAIYDRGALLDPKNPNVLLSTGPTFVDLGPEVSTHGGFLSGARR